MSNSIDTEEVKSERRALLERTLGYMGIPRLDCGKCAHFVPLTDMGRIRGTCRILATQGGKLGEIGWGRSLIACNCFEQDKTGRPS